LRDRKKTFPIWSRTFVKKFCDQTGRPLTVSPKAMQFLENYAWHGNVRELEHTIERAVALERTDEIQARTPTRTYHQLQPGTNQSRIRLARRRLKLNGASRKSGKNLRNGSSAKNDGQSNARRRVVANAGALAPASFRQTQHPHAFRPNATERLNKNERIEKWITENKEKFYVFHDPFFFFRFPDIFCHRRFTKNCYLTTFAILFSFPSKITVLLNHCICTVSLVICVLKSFGTRLVIAIAPEKR
jgi:transcriptional regulator with GAF, ATPase, and Fis domain